jgi:hypothetical protein
MLSLDDERWAELKGGYRMPVDARPLLRRLERDPCDKAVWHELWEELHHQGDVGEASYAAVPHLVRICTDGADLDWNLFALVGTIEIQRPQGTNPPLPGWLQPDYSAALEELAKVALARLLLPNDQETTRSMLAVVALWKGLPIHAAAILDFDGDELSELLSGGFQ